MEIKPFYSGRAYYDITGDNGEKYVFVPQEFVQKGFIQGGQQFYSPGFLTPGAMSTASAFTLPSDSSLTGAAKEIYKEPTKGFVWKADDFNKINYDDFSIASYQPNSTYGTIQGFTIKDGVPKYVQEPAPGSNYTLLDKDGVSSATTITVTRSGGGGVLSQLGNEILKAGPIVPLALDIAGTAFGVPGIGTAVALGTAGGLAATGQPEAALNYGAQALVGQLGIGSTVAGATGSALAGQVAQGTTAGLLTGKNLESALTSGVVGAGAGLAGSTIAEQTGSDVAGQVAAGTTAGLLSGKTGEQALTQGVGNIKVDSIIPDSKLTKAIDAAKSGDFLGQLNQLRDIVGLDRYESINDYYRANGITPPEVTVANETQVTAGQQDLTNQLADFEAVTTSAIDLNKVATVANEAQVINDQTGLQDSLAPFLKDTTASAFDTKDIIDDGSGFTVSQPATPTTSIPTTPITGNTGGNMATSYTEDPYGFSGVPDTAYDAEMNAPATELTDTTSYDYSPEEQQIIYQLAQEAGGTQSVADAYALTDQAIKDYSKGTGLTLKDAVKFFKDNPNLAKSATSLIAGGVGLFGTKLATDTAREAARVAAEAQKFKPVGVTTRFGTTDYKYDADNNLVSAGYTLTPDLKAIQDKLMSGATLSLDEAKKVADLYDPLKKASSSLFDLGTSYLAKTPEQVASDYMAKQQDLLAPSRERQYSQLENRLFQQGRGGLSVGATSARPSGARGLGATTPEMEAYYNALAQQDATLAAGAQEAGQQSVLFGKGLLGAGGEFLGKYTAGQVGAYDPFKTLLSTAGAVESMGAGALDVGTALGGRRTTAATNAARTIQPSASYNPYGSLFSGIGSDPQFQLALKDFISGGGVKPG